jgi:hypothetical protein
VLEGLERDLKAVRKAREVLGDAAPKFEAAARGDDRRGGRGGSAVLGKRRRDGDHEDDSSDGDVPEDVRRIPMPRDTPPPIPKEVLDKWYQARRERIGLSRERENARGLGTNANMVPLGDNDRGLSTGSGSESGAVLSVPRVEPKTVYEAKPVIRDLRKEAVAFVPAAVRVKMEKGKGIGGLVEPEEADRLEAEGYMRTSRSEDKGDANLDAQEYPSQQGPRAVMMEEVDDEDG